MKRLLRKAFGPTLYHGTSISALKGITAAGMLMPQEKGGAGMAPDSGTDPKDFEGFTFFTNDLNNARGYAFDISGSRGPYAVLEVSLPEDALLPDDNDCDHCKDWQESLDVTAQVKVLGTVTDNYFRRVKIFEMYYSQEPVLDVPYQGWEQAYEDYLDGVR